MLTPKFEILQSDHCVTLKIIAPFTKIQDAEIVINENQFTFYAKPYYLQLSFPGQVTEEGSSCKYEIDSGTYSISILKVFKGEHFENLDLLTTLLNNAKPEKCRPLIEVVSKTVELPDNTKKTSISWGSECKHDTSYGYGFANKLHNLPVMETLQEVIFLENPDQTSAADRQQLRMASEDEKFDSDHYLADLYEDDMVEEIIRYQPWWEAEKFDETFSTKEKNELQRLPNREYLLDDLERRTAFFGLVDILFGFIYNERETAGEDSVESSWTIRTVCSTLSWCDTPLTTKDVLIASFRRLLCYPQHRNWKLCERLQKDVVTILKHGLRCVLKCLLRVLVIFREADSAPCYLLNDLFIIDYCVWIQKERDCDETLQSLAVAMMDTLISKSDVGLEIDLLEDAAKIVIEEEKGDEAPSADQLTQNMTALRI